MKIRWSRFVSTDVYVGGSFIIICELLVSRLGEAFHMARDNKDPDGKGQSSCADS